MEITTQERTAHCHHTKESHVVTLPPSAIVNNDPDLRSKVTISYEPARKVFDVHSLRAYIHSSAEGRTDIPGLAEMVEQLAQECANAVGRMVTLTAVLKADADQEVTLECIAYFKSPGLAESGNSQILTAAP